MNKENKIRWLNLVFYTFENIMQLFYTPDINSDEYTLSKEESRHCFQVLRKKIGDIIYLVDGKGGFYKATLIGDDPKSCQLKIDRFCKVEFLKI